MSHFSVYIFSNLKGKDIKELLAPYNENIEVPKYIAYTKEQAISKVRNEIEEYRNSVYKEYLSNPTEYEAKYPNNKEYISYLKNDFTKKLNWTDDECYEYEADWYSDDMIDSEGNLYSTYNPNSKWDWYEIGGRWRGGLITKNGDKVNNGLISEINWYKTNTPFAFILPDGTWHEKGNMGWFGTALNEKQQDMWIEEFNKAINSLPDDTYITLVDCHI